MVCKCLTREGIIGRSVRWEGIDPPRIAWSLPLAKQSLLILCGARHTASSTNSLLRGLGRPLSFAHACSDVHTKEHALMCVCAARAGSQSTANNQACVRACVGSVGRGLQRARAERSGGTQSLSTAQGEQAHTCSPCFPRFTLLNFRRFVSVYVRPLISPFSV